MKKRITEVLLTALCVTAACTEKENIEIDNPSSEDRAGFRIEAVAGALTKNGLNEDLTVVWKAGDELSAWITTDNDKKNNCLKLTQETAGQTIGIFEGNMEVPQGDAEIYAVYPYNASYTLSEGKVILTLPETVNRSADVSSALPGFMVGKASSKLRIGFTYPLALIDITVDGSSSIFADNEIESLTITASKPIVGPVSYDFATGTLESSSAEANSTATKTDTGTAKSKTTNNIALTSETAKSSTIDGNTLTINYEAGAKMDTPQHAWIAVVPCDLSGSVCSILLKTTSGQEVTFNVKINEAFSAQTKYTLTLKDIDKWIDTKNASAAGYDLVAANGGERANCYIVNRGGRYKFAADYVNKAKDTAFDKSLIASADWLWSSGNKAIVTDVVYGKSGAIFFNVPASASGNAVIAAVDNSGNIVWSWHIWVTPDKNPLEPTHYTRNSAWLMSDRNIGALSNKQDDISSYGLYYQWGRKDPFPAANVIISDSKEDAAFGNCTAAYTINTATFPSAQFKSVRNTAIGSDDIAFTVANPTVNIHYNSQKSGSDAGTNTWAYNLDLQSFTALWCSATNRVKTVYDPCPAGWCVPVDPAYSWRNIDKFSITSGSLTSGYLFDATDGTSASQGGKSYYPACGSRRAGQLYNIGNQAVYWTAKCNGNAPYCLYGDASGIKNTTQRADYALNIRCMKM